MSKSIRKTGSTLFLKAVICGFGLSVFVVCGFIFPRLPNIIHHVFPKLPSVYITPAVIGIYLSAIPFYVALYQGFKLLNLIDRNKVFSAAAVKALRFIKYAGFCMSLCYSVFLPMAYLINQHIDPPGFMVMSTAYAMLPSVIGVFAGVMERVLQNAIDIKTENDLTV